MQMETRGFGWISYDHHEIIEIHDIGSGASARWILLADKSHPHLYWLQSIGEPDRAIPMCSLTGLDDGSSLRLARSLTPTDWSGRPSLIVLAEILFTPTGDPSRLDLRRPILIDAQAHRGLHLARHEDQTLQRAPSEKVAPLRKCA